MRGRPVGQVTRGKTAPNRLRLVDVFLLVVGRGLLAREGALLVDLGFGEVPVTTVELFERLRRAGLGARVVGVEIDRERAERAGQWARPGLAFRHGGFNLPLGEGEAAVVVRAFNVLRQYTPGEVAEALGEVAAGMTPGGMLIEGTCDPWGRLACWWAWERTAAERRRWGEWPGPPLRRRWLVFGGRMPGVLSPRAFQPYLPKELIQEAVPGGELDGMFSAWERGWLRGAGAPPRERWQAGLSGLAEAAPLVRWPALERRGLAVVRADAGPVAAVLGAIS